MMQQLAFGAVFGVTMQAGVFFLAMVSPSLTALVFGESLQYALLPKLLNAVDVNARVHAIRSALNRSMLLIGAAAIFSGAWGMIVGGDRFAWGEYFCYSALFLVSHLLSMWAATVLVSLQAVGILVKPTFVHLIPVPIICIVALMTSSLTCVAVSFVVAALVQVLALLLFFRCAGHVWTSALKRLSISDFMQSVTLQDFRVLVVAASLPIISAVDRYAQTFNDVADTAAVSYAWAITLGIANVLARGPNFVLSVYLHSEQPSQGRLSNKVASYVATLFLSAGIAGYLMLIVFRIFGAGAIPIAHQSTWMSIEPFLIPQLLTLSVLTVIPSLYRIVARLYGTDAAARIAILQVSVHLAVVTVLCAADKQGLIRYSASMVLVTIFGVLIYRTIAAGRLTEPGMGSKGV
ncbi:MAG: hypothetical protein ACM3SS_03895 [Rhodospirillaceae bacterium]